jgi:hypothetical protein
VPAEKSAGATCKPAATQRGCDKESGNDDDDDDAGEEDTQDQDPLDILSCDARPPKAARSSSQPTAKPGAGPKGASNSKRAADRSMPPPLADMAPSSAKKRKTTQGLTPQKAEKEALCAIGKIDKIAAEFESCDKGELMKDKDKARLSLRFRIAFVL